MGTGGIKKLNKFGDLEEIMLQVARYISHQLVNTIHFIEVKANITRPTCILRVYEFIAKRTTKNQGSSLLRDKINRTGVPIKPNVFLILFTKYRR